MTVSSPPRPRCPRTRPTGIFERPVLLDDFEDNALLQLHAGGSEDGSDRSRGASLLADDLAQVFRSDTELEHRRLLSLDLSDLDLFRLSPPTTSRSAPAVPSFRAFPLTHGAGPVARGPAAGSGLGGLRPVQKKALHRVGGVSPFTESSPRRWSTSTFTVRRVGPRIVRTR